MAALGALAIAVALAFAVTGRGAPVALLGGLAFLLGLSTLGWNALAITVVSEAVPLDAAATATGASLSIAFSAMFLVSPLFGLVADRLGSYAVAWYALAGWCAVGTVLGLLIRDRVVVATPTAS
jgi:hypothetical protein